MIDLTEQFLMFQFNCWKVACFFDVLFHLIIISFSVFRATSYAYWITTSWYWITPFWFIDRVSKPPKPAALTSTKRRLALKTISSRKSSCQNWNSCTAPEKDVKSDMKEKHRSEQHFLIKKWHFESFRIDTTRENPNKGCDKLLKFIAGGSVWLFTSFVLFCVN